jgi:hypothetical protein
VKASAAISAYETAMVSEVPSGSTLATESARDLPVLRSNLECFADFLFGGECGNPAFQAVWNGFVVHTRSSTGVVTFVSNCTSAC